MSKEKKKRKKKAPDSSRGGGPPLPPTGKQLGICTVAIRRQKVATDLSTMPRKLVRAFEKFLPADAKVYKPYLHSSNAKALQHCERKFFFEDRLGLRIRGNYQDALHRGSVFHEVTAALLSGKSRKEVVRAVKIQARKRVQAWRSVAKSNGRLPGGVQVDELVQRHDEATYKALAMAMVFCEKYPPDPQKYRIASIEEDLVVRVEGIPRQLKGTLDLALVHRDTGHVWIMDHKTTTGLPSAKADALRFDFQVHEYRLLALARFPKHHVVGCIHNIIQVPGIKYCPETKDKAGFSHYLKRVKDWYTEREHEVELGAVKKSPLVRSEVRFKTRTVPADFMAKLLETSKKCNSLPLLDKFPRCGDSFVCLGPHENRPCEFLPLCRLEKTHLWAQYIESGYYVQQHRDEESPDG